MTPTSTRIARYREKLAATEPGTWRFIKLARELKYLERRKVDGA